MAVLSTGAPAGVVQLRTDHFDGAKCLGPVDADAMQRVDQALRAVQTL
ncbi:hypothetical protein ACIA8I_19555 [Streptomyces rishiriensis]